jgi:hypothetical protein
MTTGRRPFKSSASRRRKVEEMAAKGMTRAEIAVLIGCCLPTLAKHFGDELSRGYARCRLDLVGLMWTAARRGQVGAIHWLEKRMTDGADGRTASLGKKAQAEVAARAVVEGLSWGDLLQPPKMPPRSN